MEVSIQAKAAQEVLEAPLFRALLESISDGAVVIDAQSRRILWLNGMAREVLGYREEEALGCQCRKIMNSPACSLSCPLTALLEGHREKGELSLYYRGRGGEQMLHARTRMLLVRGEGGVPLVGVELFRDLREVQALQKDLKRRRSLEGIIGHSEPMQQLYTLVEQVAPYDIPLLLMGESGVGKERFADAIHALSSRAERPFVKVNCAALSPLLVESELFGHCKGAFTGASQERRGRFEEADGGSLLLDEIGDLPLELQAKLLRVLQEGEVQRVGSDQSHEVDVRIIAATNRPLEVDVDEGRFRRDLYYRLLGARLEIPPLRERPEDLPLLVEHFLKGEKPLSEQALSQLVEYPWPGNVRELENVLRLALIRSAGKGQIEAQHISLVESRSRAVAAEEHAPASLAELERRAIEQAMSRSQGNISAAARSLGIDRTTLWRKLKKWDFT